MSPKNHGKAVSVVGGGISGLTTAYYLTEMGYQVSVYEKSDHLGGLLGSTKLKTGLVEHAANAFMANKAIEDISEKISVPLKEKKKTARKRFIFRWGEPRRWPLGFAETLGLLPFLLRWFFKKHSLKPKKQESLQAWGEKHLGFGAVQFLLGPGMQGVYGVQPAELSASLLMGPLFKPSRTEGEKGRLRGSVSPELGMGAWIQGMRTYLQGRGVEFLFEAEVSTDKDFEHPVVVATNLLHAKPWLKKIKSPLAKEIKMTALTSVTLHLGPESVSPPAGFGCLFPKNENFHSLGVLYNHHIFEGRKSEGFSETWIFDQAPSPQEDVDFRELVIKDRARLVEGPLKVENIEIHPWPQAIPVYNTALESWLESFPGHSQNIFFMGNYLGQIGLSKLAVMAKHVAEQVQKEGKWHVTGL